MASKLPAASGLYNYSRLTAISTNYAKRMNRLSKNIFGEVVRPTSAPSMRVVKMFNKKPLDIRPKIMDYYPRHNETYQFMVQACVTTQRSMRVVKMFSEKPLDLRPEITDYYPRHNETYRLMVHLRELGLFRDEHQDFKDEMKRQRILRGKERPKKGEGKRAKK